MRRRTMLLPPARSVARQNFVRFYIRIGWSSARSLAPAVATSTIVVALRQTAARPASRLVSRRVFLLQPDRYRCRFRGERVRTRAASENASTSRETGRIFISRSRRHGPENKTSAFLPIIGNETRGRRRMAGGKINSPLPPEKKKKRKDERKGRLVCSSRGSVQGFIASTTGIWKKGKKRREDSRRGKDGASGSRVPDKFQKTEVAVTIIECLV